MERWWSVGEPGAAGCKMGGYELPGPGCVGALRGAGGAGGAGGAWYVAVLGVQGVQDNRMDKEPVGRLGRYLKDR